jgi:cysteine synthase B
MRETINRVSVSHQNDLLLGVGNTPLIELRNITSHLAVDVRVFAKAEWFNPSGSVKDRPAAGIISHALGDGLLSDGRTLLDSTSGNMGIAYATLAAPLGIRVQFALPSNASQSRKEILKAFGAKITLTDPLEGTDGARLVAREMADQRQDQYFFADQYNNPANWKAHFATTGPEIWAQTGGAITHFVAGLGTTGTFTGTGRYLLGQDASIQLIGFEPESPLHGLEGLKHLPSSVIPEIYDDGLRDDQLLIKTEDAYLMARRLAREEGLLVGVSSAAAAIAALDVASELESGIVVTVFPDSGLKYLDEPFWSSS